MSCEDDVCGTGLSGINNPKPGDPDNNIALSANQVYGGINVSWSFPATNPHAVAHTILYRGLNNVFGNAIELAKVGGSIYYDRLNPTVDTKYFYWIQIRTVNGTLFDPIGPVSATARVLAEQTLESLTGLIDAGVLGQALKDSISGITIQGEQLITEIEDRIASNAALSAAIANVEAGVTSSMTYVQQEITQRTTQNSAIVSQMNVMAAAIASNLAAILQEQQVRVDADGATAIQINTLFTKTGENRAAIQDETTARTTAVSSLSQRVTTLTARVAGAEGTIVEEAVARASADNALTSRVTTTEVSLNGNVATGQVGLTTKVSTIDGKVSEIGALYTAKVQVNNLIGGFGVYNDGHIVEAGFDVDRFWVGRTGPDKVKPFIIDNDIVYINKARIRNADIDTLKIAGNAVSIPTFITGSGGASNVTPGSKKQFSNVTVVYPYDVDIAMFFNWQTVDHDSHAGETRITVEANGAPVMVWQNSVPLGVGAAHAASGKTRLSAGTYTFRLYMGNTYTSGDWDLGQWSFLILGVMR